MMGMKRLKSHPQISHNPPGLDVPANGRAMIEIEMSGEAHRS
jgi:hypothetical protein